MPLREFGPSPADGHKSFVYREGVNRIPLLAAPRLTGTSHVITADLELPEKWAEGVIIAEGGRLGGFSLYIKDGHLFYEQNANGVSHEKLAAPNPLPAGKVQVVFEFAANPGLPLPPSLRPLIGGSGTGRLSINGKLAAEGKVTQAPFALFGETLDVGSDLGTPVSNDYESPFVLNGKLEKVQIDLK
jgi:arylsulfatase